MGQRTEDEHRGFSKLLQRTKNFCFALVDGARIKRLPLRRMATSISKIKLFLVWANTFGKVQALVRGISFA
jgi:hypothetical protein